LLRLRGNVRVGGDDKKIRKGPRNVVGLNCGQGMDTRLRIFVPGHKKRKGNNRKLGTETESIHPIMVLSSKITVPDSGKEEEGGKNLSFVIA